MLGDKGLSVVGTNKYGISEEKKWGELGTEKGMVFKDEINARRLENADGNDSIEWQEWAEQCHTMPTCRQRHDVQEKC